MEILIIFWCFCLAISSWLIPLICNYENIFDIDYVLKDKKEFIRCLFMYQFFIYDNLKNKINPLGMIILFALSTFCFWSLNIIVFVTLIILLVIRILCLMFFKIFKK